MSSKSGCGGRQPERLRWFGWGRGDYQLCRERDWTFVEMFGKTSQSELPPPSCSLSDSPLTPSLKSRSQREKKRNVLKIQSHPWAKLWYEVAPSRLNFTARCCIFTIPSSFSAGQRIADTVVESRRLCCSFLFGGTIGFNQSSVLSDHCHHCRHHHC